MILTNHSYLVAIAILTVLFGTIQLLRHPYTVDQLAVQTWQGWVPTFGATDDKESGRGSSSNSYQQNAAEKPVSPVTTSKHSPSHTAAAAAAKPAPSKTLKQPDEVQATQKPAPENFDPLKQSFDIPKDIYFDPAGPRPEQIVVLTATDGRGHNSAIKDIVQLAVQNRKEYCDAHGYINHFIDLSKYDMSAHAV